MKVFVDNNHCKDGYGPCGSFFDRPIEMHFTGHPRHEDVRVAGCVVRIDERDVEDKVTFHISRQSGDTRILYVSQKSWPEAFNIWMELYQNRLELIKA